LGRGANLCPLQEALLPCWGGRAGPAAQPGCPEHASALKGRPYLLQSHLSSSLATEPAAGPLPAAFPPTPVSSALGHVCSEGTQGRKGAVLPGSRHSGPARLCQKRGITAGTSRQLGAPLPAAPAAHGHPAASLPAPRPGPGRQRRPCTARPTALSSGR